MNNTTPQETPKSVYLLSLQTVASWQLRTISAFEDDLVAALPALQRSSVWKGHQTEALWDSLLRGFPVGSFLLTPFGNGTRGVQPFLFKDQCLVDRSPSHHLLDGQQRATAIALGFADPWHEKFEYIPGVLWVDLAPPKEASDEREYVFRVLTRNHPWGYRASRPEERLEFSAMRKAIHAFKEASPAELRGLTPMKFPLTHAWPWDSEIPIPFAWLISAASQPSVGEAIAFLRDVLANKLPFWNSPQFEQQRTLILSALDGSNSNWSERLQRILASLAGWVGKIQRYKIPALVMPDVGKQYSGDGRQDAIGTLFIRVNRGGTRLDGEELAYSILKSIWPEAPQFVARLQHHIVSEPRSVMLAARLLLARNSKNKQRPPSTPDTNRFSKLLHNPDVDNENFKEQLLSFVKDVEQGAPRIFQLANELLTNPEIGLPPVLAAGLAQDAPNTFFLLLRWIDRMIQFDPKKGTSQITLKDKKRILGTLTAITWFSLSEEKCLNVLWPLLEKDEADPSKLFCRKNFQRILHLDSNHQLTMLPLVPPDELDAMIYDRVTGAKGKYGGFRQAEHSFWKDWNWDEYFAHWPTERLSNWYGRVIGKQWDRHREKVEEDGLEVESTTEKVEEAWSNFINKAAYDRRLLLFAQRKWLNAWFVDFNPTIPGALDEINRPWDFDHIHPSNFVSGRWGIPQIIRNWHGTIGNLRAWPLEANRRDQDDTPGNKLLHSDDLEQRYYDVKDGLEKRRASIIDDDIDWKYWQSCTPSGEQNFPHGYLSNPKSYPSPRIDLVMAITTRFSEIYRHWYETLGIGELMPSGQ
jgi:hypothetical protein